MRPEEQDPRLWRANGWTARVIKNEDDDGWAVEMTRDGESEPALVGPWTMGRDKKNPKPLDANAFNTLVKTASEVLARHEQHLHALLHKSFTVAAGERQVTVTLDIEPDDDRGQVRQDLVGCESEGIETLRNYPRLPSIERETAQRTDAPDACHVKQLRRIGHPRQVDVPELRRRGIVQLPEDVGVRPSEASRSLLAAQDIKVMNEVQPRLTPPSRAKELMMPADKCILQYRDKLDEFEAKGWKLDMAAIHAARARGDTIFAIPCPARRETNAWVLDDELDMAHEDGLHRSQR